METLILFILSEIIALISDHYLKVRKQRFSMLFLLVVGCVAVILHKDDIIYQVLFLMFRHYVIEATPPLKGKELNIYYTNKWSKQLEEIIVLLSKTFVYLTNNPVHLHNSDKCQWIFIFCENNITRRLCRFSYIL